MVTMRTRNMTKKEGSKQEKCYMYVNINNGHFDKKKGYYDRNNVMINYVT